MPGAQNSPTAIAIANLQASSNRCLTSLTLSKYEAASVGPRYIGSYSKAQM